MTRDEIRKIFDHALELPQGDAIKIRCRTKTQCETARRYLYQQRREYGSLFPNAPNIIISRIFENNHWTLELTKESSILENVEVVTKSGTASPLILTDEEHHSTTDPDEVERIRAAMREDGYSEDHIERILSEL